MKPYEKECQLSLAQTRNALSGVLVKGSRNELSLLVLQRDNTILNSARDKNAMDL
jgi:hypothetical protein